MKLDWRSKNVPDGYRARLRARRGEPWVCLPSRWHTSSEKDLSLDQYFKGLLGIEIDSRRYKVGDIAR